MTSATTHAHGNHPTDGRVTCLNCNHDYAGHYCSQCGQRADTHPVNWHYIWHEIPHSIWHVDRGILFTLRELLTRPGHTIREFLEGKRINHYRPLALLLILGAMVVFASHSLNVSMIEAGQQVFGQHPEQESARMKAFQSDVYKFTERHQTLVYILQIPFFAFGFWLLFRKRGYNYPEMLVTQTFITNFHLLVSLLIVLLFWGLGGSAKAYGVVMSLSMLAMIGYDIVTYYQLFRQRMGLMAVSVRSVAAFVVGYLSFILVVGLAGAAYAILLVAKDPQSFQPAKQTTTVQKLHKP